MVCSANTVLQTEQWVPAVSPVFVHVAGTAESLTTVCPFLGVSVCSTIIWLQYLHLEPDDKPVSRQLPGTAGIVTSVHFSVVPSSIQTEASGIEAITLDETCLIPFV